MLLPQSPTPQFLLYSSKSWPGGCGKKRHQEQKSPPLSPILLCLGGDRDWRTKVSQRKGSFSLQQPHPKPHPKAKSNPKAALTSHGIPDPTPIINPAQPHLQPQLQINSVPTLQGGLTYTHSNLHIRNILHIRPILTGPPIPNLSLALPCSQSNPDPNPNPSSNPNMDSLPQLLQQSTPL